MGNPLEGLLDKYGLLYKFHGEWDICEVMALEWDFFLNNVLQMCREIAAKSLFGLMFPLQFLVLPNFHSCFSDSMETRKMFSIS